MQDNLPESYRDMIIRIKDEYDELSRQEKFAFAINEEIQEDPNSTNEQAKQAYKNWEKIYNKILKFQNSRKGQLLGDRYMYFGFDPDLLS